MIYSEESKIKLNSNATEYAWRQSDTRDNSKYTSKTVTFDSGGLMVWSYINSNGTNLIKNNEILNSIKYIIS